MAAWLYHTVLWYRAKGQTRPLKSRAIPSATSRRSAPGMHRAVAGDPSAADRSCGFIREENQKLHRTWHMLESRVSTATHPPRHPGRAEESTCASSASSGLSKTCPDSVFTVAFSIVELGTHEIHTNWNRRKRLCVFGARPIAGRVAMLERIKAYGSLYSYSLCVLTLVECVPAK